MTVELNGKFYTDEKYNWQIAWLLYNMKFRRKAIDKTNKDKRVTLIDELKQCITYQLFLFLIKSLTS